ncbi:acyltransferase [Paraburkholderia aspalathi]|uniref:Acyltransferase 3 domain-containing protein n=1 Tax=Paraburkholderia nemoris TaxID=2793076 RepID=A0ABN7KNH7_9BURK|nr:MULTISPECIES: acyltransferase family protein [Paraburkholderia]MBK3808788.1 acyltransferase [Paraburkholderia aspalathi]CAE6702682.1 hypothetical protein R69776_00710 [Paraburkholderia nemoris]
MPTAKRLFCLDFVRAASVLLIIVYHFRSQLLYQYPNTHVAGNIGFLGVGFGDLGVTLFIILSGAALMASNPNRPQISDYLKKRFLAIFPAYWVAFIAATIFCLVLNGHLNDSGEYWKFLISLVGMDGFLLYRIPNYYAVGEWFVGFIIILYFIFPILRTIMLKSALALPIAIAIIFFFAHRIYGQYFDLPETRNPIMRIPDLMFGMFFIQYAIYNKKYLLLLSIAAIVALKYWNPAVSPLIYLFIVGVPVFCLASAIAESVPFPAWTVRLVAFLSKYSFLAFLVHHQLIYAFLGRIDGSKFSVLEADSLCILIVLLSFGSAFLLHPLVDKLTGGLKKLIYSSTARVTTN